MITRWPNLWQMLTGKPAYTDAQRTVLEVWNKAKAAEERGDDRGLGRARMELVQAQCERIREELGLSRTQNDGPPSPFRGATR